MFNVVVDSVADFKRLLAVKESATVVFRVRNKKLSLLVTSSELIVVYNVKAPVECDDISFAVKRETLGRIYRSGNFAVDVGDTNVTFYFYGANNSITHDATFVKLQDIESLYSDMWAILHEGRATEIAVRELGVLARLAVSQQTSLQVKDGLACVVLASNLKVFKPVKVSVSFSIRQSYLRYLMNNTSVWYKVGQYICAKCENLTFLCATDRLSECDGEYAMVHGGYKMAIKMRMLLKLHPLKEVAASHVDFDEMLIDLDKHQLTLRGNTPCNYYLEISDLKKTKDFGESMLKVPKGFLDVLGIFNEQVMVMHRKSFISVTDTTGMEVYFS